MSQFGSMDKEKLIKKPLLPLSTMKKKPPPPPPSFLSEAQVLGLLAALLFACVYAGFAAYNLRDPFRQEPEPEPASWSWLSRSYEVTGADNVAATLALLRGLMWCSAPQAAAAALALALIAGGRGRRDLDVRAAACVALAATAASHWMYLRVHGLIDSPPGDLLLAFNNAVTVAAAALDLIAFMTFVLGGDV